MAAPKLDRDHPLPFDLRDALTRSWLERGVADLTGADVVGFDDNWWDGQAHAPCLVVRGGRRHRLLRVVEAGGEPRVLPFDRRAAQRRLAELRASRRAEPGVPAQRGPDDLIVVDATADVVRCAGATCGALLPVGYDGACPVCGLLAPAHNRGSYPAAGGGGASEEKSTVTGARTAGSSTSK